MVIKAIFVFNVFKERVYFMYCLISYTCFEYVTVCINICDHFALTCVYFGDVEFIISNYKRFQCLP